MYTGNNADIKNCIFGFIEAVIKSLNVSGDELLNTV